MPDLDLSDILCDPDLAGDVFHVVRRIASISAGGVVAITGTQTDLLFGGVVPQDATLGQDPDGARVAGTIKVWAQYPFVMASGGTLADLILWNGRRYIVTDVQDYSRFGGGFMAATATLQDLVEPIPDPVAPL